ncbi:MAG: hypothetical protein PGN07_08250 [Aeromicrobium erythreum]
MTAVVIAAGGAAWEAEVLGALQHRDGVEVLRRCVDVPDLLAAARTRNPDVAVVAPGLPGLTLDAVRAVQEGGCLVLVVGTAAAGADLGADRAVAVAEVPDAVAGAGSARADAEGAPDRGRLVAVWGPAGAPGRSVLAGAVAGAAAREGTRVLLVDADVQGGAQAQLLGVLDEVSGLVAACRAAARARPDLAEHVVPVDRGVDLLSGLPRADMWPHLRVPQLDRVLSAARAHADLVVVDLGPGLDLPPGGSRSPHDVTRHVLAVADDVLVVGRADPVGVARLVRGLHDLSDVTAHRPHVVLNRVRRSIGWAETELATTVRSLAGLETAAVLPEDTATVDAAAVRGVLPHRVDRRGPFVAAVTELASRFRPLTAA